MRVLVYARTEYYLEYRSDARAVIYELLEECSDVEIEPRAASYDGETCYGRVPFGTWMRETTVRFSRDRRRARFRQTRLF